MVIAYLAIGCSRAAMRLAARDARPLKPMTYWTIVALVLADFLPAPIPLTTLDQPAIYQRLAAMDDAAAVCPVPFGFGDGIGNEGYSGRRILYYATLHGHPMVGGFIGRLPPAIAAKYQEIPALTMLLALSEDGHEPQTIDPDAAADDARDLPCRYVVLDRRVASADLVRYVESLKMRVLAADEESVLYVNEHGP